MGGGLAPRPLILGIDMQRSSFFAELKRRNVAIGPRREIGNK